MFTVIAVLGAGGLLGGCTGRGMTISSLPEGAEVSINRRVVGRTPVRVGFTHYGAYRVELRKTAEPGEGDREPVYYQPLIRVEHLDPPWYGYDPFAALADNFIPARIHDETYLHYVLKPLPNPEKEAAKRAAKKHANQALKKTAHGKAASIIEKEPPPSPSEEELRKAAYRPLLERALAARRGVAIHPVTKKTVIIKTAGALPKVTAPVKKPESAKKKPTVETPARTVQKPQPPPKTGAPRPLKETVPEQKAPPERIPFAPAEKEKPAGKR